MRFIASTLCPQDSKWRAVVALAVLVLVAHIPASAATRTAAEPQPQELKLLKQVQPDYPVQAKTFRIEGSVTLQALVGKDGRIRNVSVMDGHPALTAAAARAVEQWEYAPFLLEGRAFEAPTRIVVNFSLEK